jgi:hypothetical protein
VPNNLSLAGSQPIKPPKFAPIFTSRFFSGLWTNRSPLRDATTSRIVEKFYGQAGDAMIAGTNVEITNKLTLARRPGTTVYDSHTYADPDRFYEFRLFNASTEEIYLMIDTAAEIYSLYDGVRTSVFAKSTGSGQTYFQSVGNILYFADGLDNKKWLQTLFTWSGSTRVGTDLTPFYSTYMFDASGNLLQLVGTIFPITGTTLNAPTSSSDPTITVTSSVALNTLLIIGQQITFPATMSATYLENKSATILSITGTSMVVTYPLPTLVSATTTTESVHGFSFNGGTPTTGTVQPTATFGGTFDVSPYAISANTVGFGFTTLPIPGLSIDGTALWVSRTDEAGGANFLENGLENWGIDNSKPAPILPAISGKNPLGFSIFNTQIPYYTPNTGYAGGTYVTDSNNNIQYTPSSGTGGLVAPAWNQILGETTTDNTITWTLVYKGALSATNGGWQYGVALVNTLDNTVSNILPLSAPTGNFIGAQGIFIPPGAGLQTGGTTSNASIDGQADYVAIFRTTDGQAVPFLIPGKNGQTYTVPLSQYLVEGYNDTTQDSQLNNLISGPISNENTPPATGAINLTYHLNRLWYSIGNTVYWTTGPSTPVGNGLNGINPTVNFDGMPSLVKRLVPTTSGMLVFTVSDVYIIQGNGTAASPIQGSIPLLPGIGLLSYNALDMNGPLIGLFTTDNQFIILDPSAGTTYVGFPIGDQFLLDNGTPGQNWNSANVYVAWHVQGEDAAWYVCDGTYGWYRLMTTPAPESGYTWSPFATITGGVGVVQSVEVTPGVHRLLLGPTSTGEILQRDLNAFTDNGTPYPANATIGSIVLAQPGQIAEVAHIVTEAVKVGAPLALGLLIDEALPYYTGPIDILTEWVNDPPNFVKSRSLYSQRFWLDTLTGESHSAAMRHMQVQIIFSPTDTVKNELLTFSIFGAYSTEG